MTLAGASAVLLMAGFIIAMGVAIWSDATRYEIPDTLSIALVLGGMAGLGLATGNVWLVLAHVGLAAVVFIIGAVLFVLGVWEGGDVKLMAAISLWLGGKLLGSYVLLTALLGGVLALLLLGLRRWRPDRRWPLPLLVHLCRPEEPGIPYGVALGLAGIALSGRMFEVVFGWSAPWAGLGH